MKILWLTWKDRKNPAAGGAEVVNEELAKRLARDDHEIIFITAQFPDAQSEEECDGFRIIRAGNRFSVYWHAYRFYKKNLHEWPDLVIDEMNTIPFFAKWYVKQKNIMFVHQLCREIWFYQMPFPFSLVGYLLEPMYLRLLNDREVITISESTKKDLMCFGFHPEKIHLISEGIELVPIKSLESQKFDAPTILALGSVRPMKRTEHMVKAFEILKRSLPETKLIIAGSIEGAYGAKVLKHTRRSPYAKDIACLGPVSPDKKIELMQKSHAIAVASVKEGWGLIVTEANSQGTPAVVYNVDGLRDSVKNGETGIVCAANTPENMAEHIANLLEDKKAYERLRKSGWEWSKEITFEKSYTQFLEILNHV
jgi:glycosyltransferase involved in cell wall biosynthesis